MKNGALGDRIAYYIYRPWRKDPVSGKILWAKDYGLRAWRIPIYTNESVS
jgi:hypothetical protein